MRALRVLCRPSIVPLALAIVLSATEVAFAALIVVPAAQTAVNGNQINSYPFNTVNIRYQQAYSALEFPASPILISQISFRPDEQFGAPFNTTLANVQINLSTTNQSVNGLSTIFANNVGADDTIVHSGPLSLSSAVTGPVGGPKDFDIVINLTTPFLYHPELGNLLFDVRNFDGGDTTPFDAQNEPFDSIARAWKVNNVYSTTADLVDSWGLVTQFTYTVVPEPSSFALMLIACGAFVVAGARQKRLAARSRAA